MKIHEIFEDEHKFYIVIEMMSGPKLLDYIATHNQSTFTEKVVANIMRQVLTGLNHCHFKGLAHRDVKPENILFATPECKEVKLIDFGFAKMFDPNDSRFQELLGSPLYMAPEIVNKKPYDSKCDIWSCGIITYILLSGDVPYDIGEKEDLPSLFKQIKEKKFTLATFAGKEWKGISKDAKEFMLKMLEVDPTQRASAEECLKDKWFTTAPESVIDADGEKKCLLKLMQCNVHFISLHFIGCTEVPACSEDLCSLSRRCFCSEGQTDKVL